MLDSLTTIRIDQIHGSDINLEPDYQRGQSPLCFCLQLGLIMSILDVVWPEGKQIGIIDSVFRNFYIPPVIFGTSRHYCAYGFAYVRSISRQHV
jgi:hypothetical protein